MKYNMLEYCKLIVEKFTFHPALFKKEYRKSFRYLTVEQQSEFRSWARQKFKRISGF